MAKQYSEETKAAVMAALLAGQSASEVAKLYEIPEGTIYSWKNRQNDTPLATLARQKREIIGDLLVSYLAENIVTLEAQVIHARNEKWLWKQPASELAVLHGVIADKAIRLLEAFARAEESEPADRN